MSLMNKFLNVFRGCCISVVMMSLFVCVNGCKAYDPLWKKLDLDSFLCTQEYAAENKVMCDQTLPEGDVLLICKVRNRTRMRVYACLRYTHTDGNIVDVEIKHPSFNPEDWTTYAVQMPFLSTGMVDPKLDVQLERIDIKAK